MSGKLFMLYIYYTCISLYLCSMNFIMGLYVVELLFFARSRRVVILIDIDNEMMDVYDELLLSSV